MKTSVLQALFIAFFTLFISLPGNSSEADPFNPDVFRWNDSPLYQRIVDELGDVYSRIGDSEADRVIEWQRNLPVNDAIPGGYLYSKGFADFGYSISRNVIPDIMSGGKRWLVSDTTSIEISATQLLSNMADEGQIEMTDARLAAFAGLSFRRVFQSYHFAPSFEDGLKSKLGRLFFPFLSFSLQQIGELGPDETIRKEDFISVSAGALVDVPLGYGFGVGAGVLSSYSRLSKVEVQAFGNRQGIRLTHELESSFLIGGTASISFEFLKIIDINLLSFDTSYERTKTHKIHMRFEGETYNNIVRNESDEAKSVNKLVRFGLYDREVLEPFLMSEELREKEVMESKYALLFIRGLRKSETEQVRISKDNHVDTYFRHFFTKSFLLESFWKKMVTWVFGGILKPFLGDMKDLYTEKSLRVEYKNEYDLVASKDDLVRKDETTFSFNLSREYYSRSMKGSVRKPVRKKLVELGTRWGIDDSLFMDLLLQGQWKGAGHFRGQVQAREDALDFLSAQSRQEVVEGINQACGGKIGRWQSWFMNLVKGCYSLRKKYDTLMEEWRFNDYTSSMAKTCKIELKKNFKGLKWLQFAKKRQFYKACMHKLAARTHQQQDRYFPVWRFSKFAHKLVNTTDHPDHYELFFGRDNLYIHGALSVSDGEGFPVIRPFARGADFTQGLVQDNLVEQGAAARLPASTH